ncbi:MAG: DUF4350 domain-containing protein [Terriglobia bacterium]|jgi:hypothetical protein
MTLPLDSGDRKILLFSVCLLAFLSVMVLLVPRGAENSPRSSPSTYSTANNGAKAAYTLLGEMGYRVERWIQPPGELPAPSRDTLLIIAGPSILATDEEETHIKQFAAQGGRVLLSGPLGATMIGARGVDPTPAIQDEWRTFAAEQPAPLTRHAPEITMESSVRWVHQSPGQQRYYGDSEGATVTKIPIGKGEIIWWAGDSPLSNFGITKASNLALFLNSVGPPGQTRILWDEYFHGVRLGLWDYLERSPVPWAALQFLLLAMFIVFTYARRSGATRPIRRESRLSPLEFVVTLGALYERRREAKGALEIAYSHFRFLLARRLGIPSPVTTAELIRSVEERPGWKIPGFRDTVQEIESALKLPGVSEQRALTWIGELYNFAARLDGTPRRPKEA